MPPLFTELQVPTAEARRRIDDLGFWYHTIDVAPGVTTPGWFDLRHSLDIVPFPDVRGKRCLDIGTFDGFYAYEMERRGAAEVIAVDVEDHEEWDWPADARDPKAGRQPAMSGPPKGAGFRLIGELTGSKVEWQACNIYDLDPVTIGTFDVVVCGTLLLHLQNPIKALEAVRSVCTGSFFSSEQIELWLTVLGRGDPLARLRGTGETCQWWKYNAAAHAQMLVSAGFTIADKSPMFINRFNEHPKEPWRLQNAPSLLLRRALTRDRHQGVLHRALVGVPRL